LQHHAPHERTTCPRISINAKHKNTQCTPLGIMCIALRQSERGEWAATRDAAAGFVHAATNTTAVSGQTQRLRRRPQSPPANATRRRNERKTTRNASQHVRSTNGQAICEWMGCGQHASNAIASGGVGAQAWCNEEPPQRHAHTRLPRGARYYATYRRGDLREEDKM